MKKLLSRGVLPGMLVATSLLATACPPPASSTPVNWAFKATSVTVNDSQDEVRDPIFGACISLTGCSDEPYVLNVNFRVKIGVANSAQTFVTGSRSNAPSGVGAGSTSLRLYRTHTVPPGAVRALSSSVVSRIARSRSAAVATVIGRACNRNTRPPATAHSMSRASP